MERGGRRNRFAVLAPALLLAAVPLLFGQEAPRDYVRQREKQKQVRQDADHMVRRVGTMLRVLDYYQLDNGAEKRLLDEVAGTLSGLSRRQMNEVIARLEAAARAPDARKAGAEAERAYQRHREILTRLKGLLARYDAVKSLDQAAERLDRIGKDQFELYLRGRQLGVEWQNAPDRPQPGQKTRRQVADEVRHTGDEQGDLGQEVADFLKQLEALRPQLPREARERLNRAETAARKRKVLDRMKEAADQLRPGPEKLPAAAAVQRQAAADLQDVARALRPPRDRGAALVEARERVEQVLQGQEKLWWQAQAPPDPLADPKQTERQAQEMGDKQGRLEHAARDAKGLLGPHAPELADRLRPAEKAMQQAEESLRKNAPNRAVKPQGEAAEQLRGVRRNLDRLIAEAEKQQADPLSALRKSQEAVEQLLTEQKDVRGKTREAEAGKESERLPALSGEQQDLAERTENLLRGPLPARPEALSALDQAARSMDQAAKDLQDRKGPQAESRQEQALKDLKAAKKELAEQVAEAGKRREEIAALEDAARRLEDAARKEDQIAERAGQVKDAPEAKELAKAQDELTPKARELGEQLDQTAPEASKRVAEGARNMEGAKAELEKDRAEPGARQARQAAERLREARRAVEEALDEQRGRELAEQAALQPDEVDPTNAADQLAKALQQAQQAARESQRATSRLEGQSGGQASSWPVLAKLQQQVADRSPELKAKQAGKPAGTAARALQNGDLTATIEEQKKALALLEKSATEQGLEVGEPLRSWVPVPTAAKDVAELSRAQKVLLEITEALARSQEATRSALAALGQAQAQSPQGVQGQLQQAGQQLGNAAQQLNQGRAAPANQSQQAAVGQMTQALRALNATAAAMERTGSRPRQAVAQGQQPGQGQQPDQGEGQEPQPSENLSQLPTPGQESNRNRGTGKRVADGRMGKGAARPTGGMGTSSGAFLHLPPRQRDLIRQALTEKLPPQYAALIQQYYVNIARGKPAARPATPDGR